MEGARGIEKLTLRNLVEPARWQRLQEHFSTVLGVAIRTVSPLRELLTEPSWPPAADPDHTIRLLQVGEELQHLLPPDQLPQTPTLMTTALGVSYASIPVRATSDQIVSYFIAGPIMVGPREEEYKFAQRVGAEGHDPHLLWPLLLSLKPYTHTGIRAVLNLMEEVGTSLVQLAYQSKELSSILPFTAKTDQAVVTYHTNRVLQSLLEAAVHATQAEGGSVMVAEGDSQALRICAAKGLSEDVLATTRVQPGEGIAGLAARQRTMLIVDDQTTDEQIVNQMRRKHLVSSLVAPITTEKHPTPMGVLNLRTSDPAKRFTAEHIELLRRLLDLAGAALDSLQLAFGRPQLSPSS